MTEVRFVGTSDAFGAGGRRQSAILLRSEEGSLLLDCGATTVTGLEDLALPRDELDAIVVSHFHGDHFGGIPQLLLACLYADRREHPLVVAGPAGVEDRVRRLARHLGYSLEDRDWSFPLEFRELFAGKTDGVGPARITTFATRHQPDVEPHGLVVETAGRVYREPFAIGRASPPSTARALRHRQRARIRAVQQQDQHVNRRDVQAAVEVEMRISG